MQSKYTLLHPTIQHSVPDVGWSILDITVNSAGNQIAYSTWSDSGMFLFLFDSHKKELIINVSTFNSCFIHRILKLTDRVPNQRSSLTKRCVPKHFVSFLHMQIFAISSYFLCSFYFNQFLFHITLILLLSRLE